MAAVSDGSDKPLDDCIDSNLQRHLKGLNTATPDLSTLAQKGDEKLVDQFMSEDIKIGGAANEKLQSQLYIACFWGFYDVVTSLLDKGADLNAQNMETLWTPLHAATFQEHGKIVMLLLERNANPELPDSEGRTAKDFASASDKVWSHFAVLYGEIPMVSDRVANRRMELAAGHCYGQPRVTNAYKPSYVLEALNCPRTSKQELIEKGIIKKLEEPSRAGSAGRPGSVPKARLAAFSRPGSAYVLQSNPFAKRHSNQESSDFPLGASAGGDVLAESRTQGQGEHGGGKPAFSVWRS